MTMDDWSKELAADRAAAPNRKPGFYWVGWGQGQYHIGLYEARQFWLCGQDVPTDDQQSFDVIGPINPMDFGLPCDLEGKVMSGLAGYVGQSPVSAEPQSLSKAVFGFDIL